jgi:hypothetical protein
MWVKGQARPQHLDVAKQKAGAQASVIQRAYDTVNSGGTVADGFQVIHDYCAKQ